MEKERHFFKKNEENYTFILKVGLIIILAPIIFIFSFWGIKYNYNMSKYGYELNLYSDTTYEDLSEIANSVINEGVGIDLLSLPDNVTEYSVTSKNGDIIFTCCLNNDMHFANAPTITIKLSDNFKVISESKNISSQEEYVESVRKNMNLSAFVEALRWAIGVLFLEAVGSAFVLFIHDKKKKQI